MCTYSETDDESRSTVSIFWKTADGSSLKMGKFRTSLWRTKQKQVSAISAFQQAGHPYGSLTCSKGTQQNTKWEVEKFFNMLILNFDVEQGVEIHWHSWKEHFKFCIMAKFKESYLLKWQSYSSKSLKNFEMGKFCPCHTNVCKIS